MGMVNVATLCASAVWHASGAALSKCSFDVSRFFYVVFVSMGKKVHVRCAFTQKQWTNLVRCMITVAPVAMDLLALGYSYSTAVGAI